MKRFLFWLEILTIIVAAAACGFERSLESLQLLGIVVWSIYFRRFILPQEVIR